MPLVGDIIGNSLTPIDFSYFPQTFTTAEAVYEIRTSEFDFKPQLITIKGSAKPQKVDVRQFYDETFQDIEGEGDESYDG